MSPRDVRPHFGVLGEIDSRSALPLITSPTLVLHRPDSWMQVENSRYLAEHISGSVYRELPGVDAIAWLDDWGPLADAIQEFVTGKPSTAAHESALATVLFTDIVKSTQMVATMGDRRWTELLDRYEAVTSRELDRHAGRLVDRAGDGLFATFEGRPARSDALRRCAIDRGSSGSKRDRGSISGRCRSETGTFEGSPFTSGLGSSTWLCRAKCSFRGR